MSTFTTSKGTRAQHVFPKYQSAPYRQNPGRREHIYGKVRPMNDEVKIDVRMLIGGVVFALMFLLMCSIHN